MTTRLASFAFFGSLLTLTAPALDGSRAFAQPAPDPAPPAPGYAPPAYPYPQQPYYPQVQPYPPPQYAPPPQQQPPAWAPQPQPRYAPRYPARPRISTDPYFGRRVRGFFGASGLGTFVAGQQGGVEYLDHGGGFSFFGGLDIGRVFGLELAYTASYHNPAYGCAEDFYGVFCGSNYLMLDFLSLDGRFRIPTRSRVQPYFQAGGVIAWVGRQGYAADATGGGFEAGGGIDFWLGPYLTLGPRVLYRGIKLSDFAAFTGSETYFSLVNAELNLALRF